MTNRTEESTGNNSIHFCLCGHSLLDHAHNPRLTLESIDRFVSRIREEGKREARRREMMQRMETQRTHYGECMMCACRWYIYNPNRHEEGSGWKRIILVGGRA